jgi:glycosyltransferase involved in cell wall biosynthesis
LTAGTHVVVYSEAAQRGGAEVAVGNVIAELSRGISVTVMGVDGDVVSYLASRRPGSERHLVPLVRHKTDIASFRALRRAIRLTGADVFQANLSSQAGCRYGLLAASTVRGLNVVALEHSPHPGGGRVALTAKGLLSRRFAAHVAVGSALAATLERAPLIRRGSVRVIHLGVTDEGVEALPFPFPRPIVGTVARFVPAKRLDLLVEAAARMPAVSIVLVGDGPDGARLRQLASELGVSDRVHMTGWLDDPRAALASFDVFALPSCVEGLSLTILEAMMLRVPVVAADVGSVRDAVVPGESGLLTPPGDGHALTAALERLLTDVPLRGRLAGHAHDRALEEFSAAGAARRFEALYAALAASRTAS